MIRTLKIPEKDVEKCPFCDAEIPGHFVFRPPDFVATCPKFGGRVEGFFREFGTPVTIWGEPVLIKNRFESRTCIEIRGKDNAIVRQKFDFMNKYQKKLVQTSSQGHFREVNRNIDLLKNGYGLTNFLEDRLLWIYLKYKKGCKSFRGKSIQNHVCAAFFTAMKDQRVRVDIEEIVEYIGKQENLDQNQVKQKTKRVQKITIEMSGILGISTEFDRLKTSYFLTLDRLGVPINDRPLLTNLMKKYSSLAQGKRSKNALAGFLIALLPRVNFRTTQRNICAKCGASKSRSSEFARKILAEFQNRGS